MLGTDTVSRFRFPLVASDPFRFTATLRDSLIRAKDSKDRHRRDRKEVRALTVSETVGNRIISFRAKPRMPADPVARRGVGWIASRYRRSCGSRRDKRLRVR